jgi:hypothetical protein
VKLFESEKSTSKTETIAEFQDSLMKISLKLTPKLFGAELAGILIGDDQ